MSNNGFFIISAILGLGIPAIVVISSVILFIVKIIEKRKMKISISIISTKIKNSIRDLDFLYYFLRIKETMI